MTSAARQIYFTASKADGYKRDVVREGLERRSGVADRPKQHDEVTVQDSGTTTEP